MPDHDADEPVAGYEAVVAGVPARRAVVPQQDERSAGHDLAGYLINVRVLPFGGHPVARYGHDTLDEEVAELEDDNLSRADAPSPADEDAVAASQCGFHARALHVRDEEDTADRQQADSQTEPGGQENNPHCAS
jgi:hypothetical protein